MLLIVTGEFGRTPRLSYAVGTSSGVMQPGRDHWPNAMSLIVSGGGMRTGQVVGATNAQGRISDRTAALAQRSLGHGAVISWASTRTGPSTISPAARCRFCR